VAAVSAWDKIDDLRARVGASVPVVIDTPRDRSLKNAQEALEKSNFTPDRLVVMGWEIVLSRRTQDGIVRWHLSAMLHPHGRSSTENDWKIVGKIAARIGAPQDPAIVPEDSSAAIHWSWIEQ
jgi:hypothetical protein